ncbi:hypothetical protein Droror1_Dr00006523 [Drosera rotundifolia]
MSPPTMATSYSRTSSLNLYTQTSNAQLKTVNETGIAPVALSTIRTRKSHFNHVTSNNGNIILPDIIHQALCTNLECATLGHTKYVTPSCLRSRSLWDHNTSTQALEEHKPKTCSFSNLSDFRFFEPLTE